VLRRRRWGDCRLDATLPRSSGGLLEGAHDVSVFDAVALLIGLAVVGLLPIGPSLGAATAVLILGTNGVTVVTAAGALLTATAAVGALCFAFWALVDRLRPSAAAAAAPA
jgi:hypothetical protein